MRSTEVSYCGWVAIVGRPNVGKSTLLNRLLGQKIAITSCKPQTTRHRLLGVHTDGLYQSIYVDTPGLHRTETQVLNRLMNRAARHAMQDVDLILWMVEGTNWCADDELVLTQLRQQRAPVVLAINKIDLLTHKSLLLPHIALLNQKMPFVTMVPLSAGHGEQIDTIATLVRGHLPAGPHHFPKDQITDRTQRFLVAEIIREKLIRFLGDELPYAVTVEIEAFKQQATGSYLIHGLIWVSCTGQKKIVIGAKGQKIKVIGSAARLDIETLLAGKVHLDLWVKIKSGWADDERALRNLGYGND